MAKAEIVPAQVAPGIFASSITTSSTPPFDGGLVTNGDFSNSSAWIIETGSITGGEYVSNSTAAYNTLIHQDIAISHGNSYTIEFDVINFTSGILQVLFGNTEVYDTNYDEITANGHYTITILHDNTNAAHTLTFYTGDNANNTFNIDNVECYLAP